MKRKLSLLLVMILIVSSFLIGCSKGEPTDGKDGKAVNNPAATRKDAKDTLIVGTTEAKGEFLPVYFNTLYDRYIVDLIYDKLFEENEKGEIIPHLAKEWEISEDHKTYTLKLRDDVKFSDGEPLTAKDAEFTYLLMMDPNYDGRYSSIASHIEGYDEYNKDTEGKITNVSGIKVIDEYTISYTFKDPLVTNIRDLKTVPVMPKHAFPDYKKGRIDVIKAQMDKPLGSGMYTFEAHEPKQFIKLKANEDYFISKPKIENIIVKFTTAETMISEIQTGSIDVQIDLPPTKENEEMLSDSKFIDKQTFLGNSYYYLGFNLRDERLSDKNVRQALTYGFNRQQFVDNYYKGFGSVINSPISQASWAYSDDINKYEYSEEKAKELLESAGWKVGADGIREKNGKKLDFVWDTYIDSKYVEALIPMLKADWEKIGVKVDVNLMEFNALVTKVRTERKFDMFNMGWTLTSDPDSYDVFHSDNDVPDGSNSGGFKNAKNDEIITKGREEFDQEKRVEIYKEWSQLVNEELPYIFINQNEHWDVYNKRVKNLNTSPYIKWSSPSVILGLELEQ